MVCGFPGVGAAAAGLWPLVSITYMDFLMLGLDPLVNYAAKLRFKTGGQLAAPLVVKTTAGARGQGVAHSQCLEAWLMGVPGLKVVAPSTAADAYGLMKAALRAEGPVVFVDHKLLFPTADDVPVAGTVVALGEAAVRREGGDATVVTHGYMTRIALAGPNCVGRSRRQLRGDRPAHPGCATAPGPSATVAATSVRRTGGAGDPRGGAADLRRRGRGGVPGAGGAGAGAGGAGRGPAGRRFRRTRCWKPCVRPGRGTARCAGRWGRACWPGRGFFECCIGCAVPGPIEDVEEGAGAGGSTARPGPRSRRAS